MIQDITPYCYRVEYKEIQPRGEDVALLYQGNQVLLREISEDTDPLGGMMFCGELPGMAFRYLFAIEAPSGRCLRFFLGQWQEDAGPGESEVAWMLAERLHAVWKPVNIFRTLRPRVTAFALITGYQMYGWYRDTRFCPRCGKVLHHAEKERMLYCPECGLQQFPKIAPAVIVAVINGDKLLMTKYAGRDYTRYALIAGFAETGETIEQTVHREVMEEVGLRVKNLRFYKSQPWSLTSTLLFGFFVQLDGSDEIRLKDGELSVGEWLTRDQIEEDENQESLTWEMIECFKHGNVPDWRTK